MQRAITTQGSYRFSVPLGSAFTVAITGAFNGATATIKYLNDVAGVVTEQPFSTTGLSLTAAGEKSGINVGSHSEIVVAVTVANPTGIVVNVNPSLSLGRELR
jgi:hypothetical protein